MTGVQTCALPIFQPDCIYVQNLDLLLFAEKYKRKNGNALKLVYEISDINDILIQPQKKALKKAAQVYLQNAEKTACKNVDLLCYTSPAFFEERYGALVPKEKSMYLPNIPNMTYFDGYIPHPWEDFTIGYIGTVRYEKQLRLMLDAAKEAGIASMIAGGLASGGSRGSQVNLRGLQEDYSDTEFIGAFDYPSQIANIYGRINVSFAVYDTNLRNVKVALPNKLYEAIRCRIPLIVAPGTYLAEIVERLGIGLASNNLQEITHFLIHLREDKQYYKQFQDACEKHQDEIDADMINSTFCSWFKE